MFRERAQEGEKEGEKQAVRGKEQLGASCTRPGSEWTCHPYLCPDWESNWQPFTLQMTPDRLSLIRQSTWNPLKSLVSSCKAITTFWLLSQKISFELSTSRHLKHVLLWSVTHLFTLLRSVAKMDPVEQSFVQVYCYFLIYFNEHGRQWSCFLFCYYY